MLQKAKSFASGDDDGEPGLHILNKVERKAKNRNQCNQVPHLTRNTIWVSDKITIHKRAKRSVLSQQVINKPARNRQDRITKTNMKHKYIGLDKHNL